MKLSELKIGQKVKFAALGRVVYGEIKRLPASNGICLVAYILGDSERHFAVPLQSITEVVGQPQK